MDTTTAIMVAVARADLLLTYAERALLDALPTLLIVVLVFFLVMLRD